MTHSQLVQIWIAASALRAFGQFQRGAKLVVHEHDELTCVWWQ